MKYVAGVLLAVLGLFELVLRGVLLIICLGSVIGALLIWAEESLSLHDLLTPELFKMARLAIEADR